MIQMVTTEVCYRNTKDKGRYITSS